MDADDTLLLILERLDSSATLIRAASTCRRWRRVIADAGFLRHFHDLHGGGGDPIHVSWFVPSSPSNNDDDVRYLSLDFIGDKNIFLPRFRDTDILSWNIVDSRGSLLLIECSPKTHIGDLLPELVVCEPVTQRYKIIPQPPDYDGSYVMFHSPYLVDGDEDVAGGHIGMSNFRVSCLLFSRYDHVACTTVFTARATDLTWSEKPIVDHLNSRLLPPRRTTRCLGHVLGSCYFYVQQDGILITCNGSTGAFSPSVLSGAIRSCWDQYIRMENFSVVDGGDGEPRIIAVTDHTMEVFGRVVVDGEWTLENKIMLSKATCDILGYDPLSFFNISPIISRRGVGFVVITWWWDLKQHWHFSVDLKTMEVAPATDEDWAYRCEFPWPPVLQACLNK